MQNLCSLLTTSGFVVLSKLLLLYICVRTWFEHHSPTVLRIDGHKIKYQFSLHGELLYTGLDAWVRGWNERERRMMERVHLPNWRGLAPQDAVASHTKKMHWLNVTLLCFVHLTDISASLLFNIHSSSTWKTLILKWGMQC